MSLNRKIYIFLLLTLITFVPILKTHAEDAISFEEKQRLQVSEILTGTIMSIHPMERDTDDVGKDYYFELEISEIEKTTLAPRIGDTVKVRFVKGFVLLTGNKPMMAEVGDVVKIYADNDRRAKGFLKLKYGGDSVYIINGVQPTDIETFFAMFGVERSNVYFRETAMVVGVLIIALIFAQVIIRTFKIHKR